MHLVLQYIYMDTAKQQKNLVPHNQKGRNLRIFHRMNGGSKILNWMGNYLQDEITSLSIA